MDLKRQEKPLSSLNVKIFNKMSKKSIHPDWYPNAKVYCDGQLIMKVGSTKERLNVDIWSGNHPFYTGSQKFLIPRVELSGLCVNTVLKVKLKNNFYANNSTTG